MYFCENKFALNVPECEQLIETLSLENKFFASLLLEKFDTYFDLSNLPKLSLSEKNALAETHINKILKNIITPCEPNFYNFTQGDLENKKIKTDVPDTNTFKDVLKFFGTYKFPFSVTEFKNRLNDASEILLADAEDFELDLETFIPDEMNDAKDLLDINKNKFFGNNKIYIITFLHYAISRYISESLITKNQNDQHWNRCLLFFHGCVIIKLLSTHYLGTGRLECFTQIHSKLTYFFLKELQKLKKELPESLSAFLVFENFDRDTNYKCQTQRIINNLNAFADGYVVCRCPYLETNFNRKGLPINKIDLNEIKKECNQSCIPCIFNHRLWPSSCSKLNPNQFRYVFNISSPRRKMQNYFNINNKELSLPIEILYAIEETTGIPSFCIDGILPDSKVYTPLSLKVRSFKNKYISSKDIFFPHESWSIHIFERDAIFCYLQSVYKNLNTSIEKYAKYLESITIWDDNKNPLFCYDKFIKIYYPPSDSNGTLTNYSFAANIKYQSSDNEDIEFAIPKDKYQSKCLCETMTNPKIEFETENEIINIENCFADLKRLYFNEVTCKTKIPFVKQNSRNQLKKDICIARIPICKANSRFVNEIP